jgi:hypothetical protein
MIRRYVEKSPSYTSYIQILLCVQSMRAGCLVIQSLSLVVLQMMGWRLEVASLAASIPRVSLHLAS